MKYSIKRQIFFTSFLENPKIGIWKKNKEIESNKIKTINILKKVKTKYVVQYYDSIDEDNNVYIII